MSSVLLIVAGTIAFIAAYFVYGRYLSRVFEVHDARRTPAHDLHDGVDYVPARMPVLLGHHFASIAGAGPIIGPIAAAAYGWGPVFLWIVIGAIFVGAVHDFASMIASVRHSGRSIGEVIEARIGYSGKVLFLVFSWSALILVVAVFAVVVAQTFISEPSTATSSILFSILAIVFGVCINRFRMPLGWATVIFLPLLVASIGIGVRWPIALPTAHLGSLALPPLTLWVLILLVYCFIASVAPVWVLLQPRDYLSSFLLYGLIFAGIVGGIAAHPPVKTPAFVAWSDADLGPLFPMLFVTVACGAISGFHSLVASGTSSKQINRETDALPVGYGAMLIEGILAIVALITAVRFSAGEYAHLLDTRGPINVFASGIGCFVTKFRIPEQHGTTFGALAVSAFALTTLDTATRIARYCFQELVTTRRHVHTPGRPFAIDRFSATAVCVVLSAALALSGQWKMLWPLFGSANQLLAALALLAISVWLFHLGKRMWFLLVPAAFMFFVTLAALATLFSENLAHLVTALGPSAAAMRASVPTYSVMAAMSLVLGIVAVILLILGVRVLLRGKPAKA
ncbi:carbon starvation protein A [bacterium]|nr:carbon starvation protein A [bacterium]